MKLLAIYMMILSTGITWLGDFDTAKKEAGQELSD